MALADRLPRPVIVNADSAQLYRGLPVLSAAPTESDVNQLPHRLYLEWDGATACSAADWAVRAREVIEQAHRADEVPILVGGTGLYIRTLLDGIAPVPAIDPAIREQVRALPIADAYAALQLADPERAAALNPADTTRVARALEVVRSTGRPLAHWQERREGGIGEAITLFPAVLLPEREWLYARCDLRFERMLEQGAVEEVEALLARNLSPALPVMRAIGVPEIAGWLRGEWSRDEALARGQQATRNYAKRQYTWFRRQPPEHWPRIGTHNYDVSDVFETLFRYSGLT